MIVVFQPQDEAQLVVAQSVLDAAGIPYFVRNDFDLGFTTAIGHRYLGKPINVRPEDVDRAREALGPLLTSENSIHGEGSARRGYPGSQWRRVMSRILAAIIGG